jgi:competence protein ComEA
MKPWQTLVLGIFIGLLATGLVLLVASRPRGQPITLRPAPTAAPLVVYITGAVNHPGVYNLLINSRVNDALAAAGGIAPEGDATLLNLAAPLHDGERIWVPAQTTPTPTMPVLPTETNRTQKPTATPTLVPPSPQHPLNINTASLQELQTLPGIGPTRAQQIIDYRQANGLFMAPEDLMKIPGIGTGTFAKLKDLITVQPQP